MKRLASPRAGTDAPCLFTAGATVALSFSLDPGPPNPPPPPPPPPGEGEGEGEGEGGLTCNCPEQITVVVRAVSEDPAHNEHVELTANGTTYHSDESDEVSCVVTQGTPIRVKAIPSYEGFQSWSSTPASPIHGCLFEDPPEQQDWFFVTDHDHGDLEIVAMFAKGSRVVNPRATGYGYVTIDAPGCSLTPSGNDTEIEGPIRARVTVEVTGQNGYQWGHWTWEGAYNHERYEPAVFRLTNPLTAGDPRLTAHVWASTDSHLSMTYRTVTVTPDQHGYVTGFTCPSYINPSIDALLIVAEQGQADAAMQVADAWKVYLNAHADPGYEFGSWYDAGEDPISTQDTSLTLTNVSADAAYSVQFRARPRLTVTTAVVDKDGNPYDGDEFETHCGGYVTRNDTHYDYATAQAVSLTAHAFISCGWAFHHWEEDRIEVIATGVLPVTMDDNRKVKAVFAPQATGPCKDLIISAPSLAPPTANNFAYNDSATDACNVHAEGTTEDGTQNDLLQWYLTSISGSSQTCTNNARGPSVTFTYSALPDSNNSFGDKTLRLSHPNRCEYVARTVQIFFAEEATNHPGAGHGTVPNWYYYWEQTDARGGGSHTLAPGAEGSRTFWDAQQHRYAAYIGRDAFDEHTFVENEGLWARYTVRGIHCYAYACRHEAKHVEDFTLWWNGDDNNRNQTTDRDGDWIPNDIEPTLASPGPFNPDENDSNSNGTDDVEEWCTWKMAPWDFWEVAPVAPPEGVPKVLEYDWGANGTQADR